MLKHLLILMVRAYQVTLGPLIAFMNGGRSICRHQPTCSHYAVEALQRFGALKGGWLTVHRLFRCTPWGTCGYDPVPPLDDGEPPRGS